MLLFPAGLVDYFAEYKNLIKLRVFLRGNLQEVAAIASNFVHVVTRSVIEAYCIQSLFANVGFDKNRMEFSKTRACDA